MKTIALLNEKGGVGKTTLALHIAAGLAVRGQRVLVLDADAQANATSQLGITPRAGVGLYSMLVHDGSEWADNVMEVDPARYASDAPTGSLLVCPSSVETRVIPMMIDQADLLAIRLDELAGYVDVVVIDTSPTPSLLHSMIYHTVDAVVFPTEAELMSLEGVHNTHRRIEQVNKQREMMGREAVRVLGIQPNKINPQTRAHQLGLKYTLGAHKRAVWPGIPVRTIWRDAAWKKETLFRHAPEDIATTEAWAMVERVERGVA
jgi:chromosome partitioning protein